MRKMLIVAFFSPPALNMGSLRLLRFVRNLQQYGWSADILTARESRYAVTDEELSTRLPAEAAVFRENEFPWRPNGDTSTESYSVRYPQNRLRPGSMFKVGVQTLRDWIPPTSEPRGWQRLATKIGIRLVQSGSYACLYSSSGPLSSHRVALAIEQASGIPWVAEFRDAVLDNPYLHLPTVWHRQYYMDREGEILRKASQIIVTSWSHREALKLRYGTSASISVVSNGFDPSEYPQEVQTEPGRFVISYAGNLYGARSILPFLLGWKEWLTNRANRELRPCLRIYGETFNADLSAFVRMHGLQDSVEIVGVKGHSQVMTALKTSNVVLVIKSPADTIHIPGKLYESMGAGRPILLIAPASEASRLVDDHRAGVWISCQEPKSIAGGLERIAETAGRIPAFVPQYRVDRLTACLAQTLDTAVSLSKQVLARGVDAG